MASQSTPDGPSASLPGATSDASAPPTSDSPAGYNPYAPYAPYPPYASYPDAGYAPYPYPAYPAPVYYPWMFAPPAPRMSTWALVSMICGAIAIASFQPILAVLAVVFGFIGRNEVKKSAGQVEGNGMSIAGIVMGFVSLAISLVFVLIYILYFVVLLLSFSTMPG